MYVIVINTYILYLNICISLHGQGNPILTCTTLYKEFFVPSKISLPMLDIYHIIISYNDQLRVLLNIIVLRVPHVYYMCFCPWLLEDGHECHVLIRTSCGTLQLYKSRHEDMVICVFSLNICIVDSYKCVQGFFDDTLVVQGTWL